MIIVEDRLRELFNTLPQIDYDGNLYTPIFDHGNPNDLNKFIRQEEKKYPLIWLESEYPEDKTDLHTVNVSLSIILATYSGDLNQDNSQRLEDKFKKVLIPLLDNIDKAFERGNTILFEDRNYRVTKFFNYGKNQKHTSTDIWDAIKLEVDLNINDYCLKPFNYG